MTRARQPSPQTAAVLRALAADPAQWRYGYELGQEVGLKAGSLYPILIRLSDRGLLEAILGDRPAAGPAAAAPVPADRRRPVDGRGARPGAGTVRQTPHRAARCLVSADLLLALVVRLLPAGRRDWGRAMRAETAVAPARP